MHHIAVLSPVFSDGWLNHLHCCGFYRHLRAPFYQKDPTIGGKFTPDFTPIVRISYGVLHRPAFALSAAWIIFACSQNYAGENNSYLSNKTLSNINLFESVSQSFLVLEMVSATESTLQRRFPHSLHLHDSRANF